jgi:hypothetical protein
VSARTKDEGIVLGRIASGFYSAVELDERTTPSFLGPRIPDAVAARYRKLPGPPSPFNVYVASE